MGEGYLTQDEVDALIQGPSSDTHKLNDAINRSNSGFFLSQDDLDALLQTRYDSSSIRMERILQETGIEGFQEYIRNISRTEEDSVGINPAGTVTLRFFDDPKKEKMLSEIRKKNAEDGSGKIFLGGSALELLNCSCCPECRKIYSFSDLQAYYSSPPENRTFGSRREQLRNETAVRCTLCKTYFIPSLVIIEKVPIGEVQFLCRVQTADAIEKFYSDRYGKKFFS